MDSVPLLGTTQSYPRLPPLLPFHPHTKLIEYPSARQESWLFVHRAALTWSLRRRFELNRGDVVVINLPPGLDALIALQACALDGLVAFPLGDDVNGMMAKVRPRLYVAKAEEMWKVDYGLRALRITGVCVDAGPFPEDVCVSVRTFGELEGGEEGAELDESFVMVEDGDTVWDVTLRSALMVARAVREVHDRDEDWSEWVVGKLDAVTWLKEVLPRCLQLDEDDKPALIVFDANYQSRTTQTLKKRPVRRPNSSNSSELPVVQVIQQQPKFTCAAEILLSCSNFELCAGEPLMVGLVDVCNPKKVHCSKLSPGTTGLVALSGPAMFRCALGNVSKTVSCFIIDCTGRLWFMPGDVLVVASDGSSLCLPMVTRKKLAVLPVQQQSFKKSVVLPGQQQSFSGSALVITLETAPDATLETASSKL